jgi:hypothetical protein
VWLDSPHTFSIFAVDSDLVTGGCVCVCTFASHGIDVVCGISNFQGIRIRHAFTLSHRWR